MGRWSGYQATPEQIEWAQINAPTQDPNVMFDPNYSGEDTGKQKRMKYLTLATLAAIIGGAGATALGAFGGGAGGGAGAAAGPGDGIANAFGGAGAGGGGAAPSWTNYIPKQMPSAGPAQSYQQNPSVVLQQQLEAQQQEKAYAERLAKAMAKTQREENWSGWYG